MIVGSVNVYGEAVVRLRLAGPEGQAQDVEAVVDTGFNGSLTLPPSIIAALGLPFRRSGRALLADGREALFDVHEAFVDWEGQSRRVAVDAAETDPLLGMALLRGCELKVQVVPGGGVFISPLP